MAVMVYCFNEVKSWESLQEEGGDERVNLPMQSLYTHVLPLQSFISIGCSIQVPNRSSL